jgi:hypothetical protein
LHTPLQREGVGSQNSYPPAPAPVAWAEARCLTVLSGVRLTVLPFLREPPDTAGSGLPETHRWPRHHTGNRAMHPKIVRGGADLAQLWVNCGLPAGPPHLAAAESAPLLELKRAASAVGHLGLSGTRLLAAEALRGRVLGIRVAEPG